MNTKLVFAIVNTADPGEIAALSAELHLVYGDDAVVLGRYASDTFDLNNYLRASLDNIIAAGAVIKGKPNKHSLPVDEILSDMENAAILALGKPVIQEIDLIRRIIVKEYNNDSKSDK